MKLKKVNIIGKQGWHVFVKTNAEELESLLRLHLGFQEETIRFSLETVKELNEVLKQKGLSEIDIKIIRCTGEEYAALGLKDAGPPPSPGPGYWWLFSKESYKYDTLSGDLDDDSYAVEPRGSVLIKAKGKELFGKRSEADIKAVEDELTALENEVIQ